MGVRCDRDDLAFFPNIYNEDWFFFSEEAASHKIARVGVSRQREYDPYEDPQRAVKEEFGDLLAEGLYARLDVRWNILDVDVAYWTYFIESRKDFLKRVAESLTRQPDSDLNSEEGRKVRAAQVSIRAGSGSSWSGSSPEALSEVYRPVAGRPGGVARYLDQAPALRVRRERPGPSGPRLRGASITRCFRPIYGSGSNSDNFPGLHRVFLTRPRRSRYSAL